MRKLILLSIALFLSAMCASAQAPVVTPATPPAVNASGTVQFNCTSNCTSLVWTCPGCAGSISVGGLYTAPATINSQQSWGGYQLLPNDHIYNTRIDSLPVNANSTTWVNASIAGGSVPFSYQFAFPTNYITSSTPTVAFTFTDTPGNNGNFQVPTTSPYPFMRQETGIYAGACCDRHFDAIRTDTGSVQEMYNIFGHGSNQAVSGIIYSNATYNLANTQGGGSTDAAGLYIMPLTLRKQELAQAIATSGSIKHALRISIAQGYMSNTFIWPATSAPSDPGTIPFGARFRLKAAFNCGTFSAGAQVLCNQLKQYGLIISDGGTDWAATIEYAPWAGATSTAVFEINNAAIAPTNFEAVDESGLEAYGGASGAVTTSEHIVATASGGATSQFVVLTGVTVNLPKDKVNFQAGSPALQFSAYVQGSANTGVTWTMSPSLGTLTSGGLYTPPATSSTVQNTIVTATSNADGTVAASMDLQVLPNLPDGVIRTVGACCGGGADYTDSNGHVWYHLSAEDGCIATGSAIGSWPAITDITLYISQCDFFGSNPGDGRFDIYVPNGTYQITGKFGDAECNGPGTKFIDIETMGVINYSNVDINAAAGGCYKPIDYTTTATVTNGLLSYAIRYHGNSTLPPQYNAVSIALTSGLAGSVVPSNVKIAPGVKIQ